MTEKMAIVQMGKNNTKFVKVAGGKNKTKMIPLWCCYYSYATLFVKPHDPTTEKM